MWRGFPDGEYVYVGATLVEGGQEGIVMGATAFIASEDQPLASRYYQFFPDEPVSPSGFIKVERVISIASINVLKLFTAMTNNLVPKDDVLVVSHGFGGGLRIPLLLQSKIGLDLTVAGVLNRYVGGSLTQQEAALQLELRTSDLLALKEAILNVRQLKINKLILRSCKVGAFEDTLTSLKRLFGATSACAPDVFDCFNTLDPGPPADAKTFAQFLQLKDVISEGRPPDRFARTKSTPGTCNFEVTAGSPHTVMAESRSAVIEWIARHFPKGKYPGKGPFAFHAQVVGDRVVFPLDPEYRNHLKQV